MKKLKIFALLLVFILLCCSLLGCDTQKYLGKEVNIDFDDFLVKPTIRNLNNVSGVDNSKVTLSADITEQQAVKESACYLYHLANTNAQLLDFFAYISEGNGHADVTSNGLSLRGNMEVRDYFFKDNAKKYFETIGVVMSGENLSDGKDITTLLGAVRLILNYAERNYTQDGVTFYKQRKSGADVVDENTIKDFNPPSTDYVNWDKIKKTAKFDKKSWYEEDKIRNHHYEIDNADIKPEYLKNAQVTHNKKEGFYEVYYEVIPTSPALELGRQSLRKSTGSKNLDYVYQKVSFSVWEDGVFRMYSTDNSWKADIAIFKGVSQNKYSRYFTYNRESVKKLAIPNVEWINKAK